MTMPGKRGDSRRLSIPPPRAAGDEAVNHAVEEEVGSRTGQPTPEPRYPWPEPWRSDRGTRPPSDYWDPATASWHSRGRRGH